jgi:hypothetical protein
MVPEIEQVFAYPMSSGATRRGVQQIVESPDGTVTMLVREVSSYLDASGNPQTTEFSLFALQRPPGGAWRATRLLDDRNASHIAGAILPLGRAAYVATISNGDIFNGTCGGAGQVPCGFYGTSFLDGVIGPAEVLDSTVKNGDSISLAVRPNGELIASWAGVDPALGPQLFIQHRLAAGGWSPRELVAAVTDFGAGGAFLTQPDVAIANDQIVSFYFSDTLPTLRVKVGTSAPEIVPTPKLPGDADPCDIAWWFAPWLVAGVGGQPESLVGVTVCENGGRYGWVRIEFHPGATGAARWNVALLDFPAGKLPAGLEPMPPSGGVPFYAGIPWSADSVSLLWRDASGWQSRPALILGGDREVWGLSAGVTASGDPLIGMTVGPLSGGPNVPPDVYVVRYHR